MEFKLKEKYKTEEEKLEAVKEDNGNRNNILYIKNPSEEVQLAAVKESGSTIQFIKNPSEKVQLEAVKQNGWAIEYIENPSEGVQLAAVKNDGWAIEYIKNPSEEVQLEAVRQDGDIIQYIKNPSEKVQLEAVKKDPLVITNKNIVITEKIIIAAATSKNLKEKENFKYLLAAQDIDWNKISDETKLLIEML